MNEVLYMVQARGPLSPVFNCVKNNLLVLTFNEPIPETTIHAPGTTWTEGRNLLYQHVIDNPEFHDYKYYCFMDDDVVASYSHNGISTTDWLVEVSTDIIESEAAVAFPKHWGYSRGARPDIHVTLSTGEQKTISSSFPLSPETIAEYCTTVDWFDAACNFYRKDVFFDQNILPYDLSLDKNCWHASQFTQIVRCNHLYKNKILQFNKITLHNGAHTPYPNDRSWVTDGTSIVNAVTNNNPESFTFSECKPFSSPQEFKNANNMKKNAIITTINKRTDTFVKNFTDLDYHVYIAGDLKTPHQDYIGHDNITYTHPEEACQFESISKILPYNHYCRKNIGYLQAINSGVESLVDTDDDNFPIGDIYTWKTLGASHVTSPGIPNILSMFHDSHVWSRGYPLELVNQDVEMDVKHLPNPEDSSVGIVQSLVNGDPDVDAINRLTSAEYSNDIIFTPGNSFIFEPGVYTQGNTQATLWQEASLFDLLYIPVTVSFRFCDILKMYVAQRCMWERGYKFAVTSPFYHQTRNAHDYMKDFESETSMYTCLLKLLQQILPGVKLKGDREDIIRVYEKLCMEDIVTGHELVTLKRFLEHIPG